MSVWLKGFESENSCSADDVRDERALPRDLCNCRRLRAQWGWLTSWDEPGAGHNFGVPQMVQLLRLNHSHQPITIFYILRLSILVSGDLGFHTWGFPIVC